MNKKAQSLTINTVVIAVLAVLVLVVLFYIFTTKTGGFAKQLKVCPGECMSANDCIKYGGAPLPDDYLESYSSVNTCADKSLVCCSVKKPDTA
ncbi:hypothetical protein KY314_02305 [Candidatus Woesearchaeota archaeon]|nr:hypothetical protein [Candidatus Woesearchaeota archaeon]